MKKLLLILASFTLLAGCMIRPSVVVEERPAPRYYVETTPVYVYRYDRPYRYNRSYRPYKRKIRVVRRSRARLYKKNLYHRRGYTRR
tara:strand:+ start:27 stop:287 length:261 start_codon:yes stop_codon:yes gene_type:complete